MRYEVAKCIEPVTLILFKVEAQNRKCTICTEQVMTIADLRPFVFVEKQQLLLVHFV